MISSVYLKSKAYIDGQWVSADDSALFSVYDPANGDEIAQVADCGQSETSRAVAAADVAFREWSILPNAARADKLVSWHDLMLAHEDELARILTAEMGKPLAEAVGEIRYGASYLLWYAEEAKRIYGDIIPHATPDARMMVIRQPVGVCAAITPWNFPNAMLLRKAAAALAAGCTMVAKPAEDTPLSALAIAALAEKAGVPAGVFNVIPSSNAQEVGLELTSNATVRKVSFTGSTQVGRKLLAQSAETVKKISLELGGNAPFIIFDDADIDAAIAGVMASKYRNAGQTCVCANRIFVQRPVHDTFVERLVAAVGKLKVGPGEDPASDIGPLINQAALDKVEKLVAEAQNEGATLLTGGMRDDRGGLFYRPTILGDATNAMAIAQSEIFGPIAPIIPFDDEADVYAQANDTPYGLAAYVYTRDLGRAWRAGEALDYGMVGVNQGIISAVAAPFGGVKQSGIGREGSKYGLDDYLELKYLCLGGIAA
ncbi:MAG: NAD-dependent succinate-semialdehyde dehydrogenase [Pseudomonadota bacterium]